MSGRIKLRMFLKRNLKKNREFYRTSSEGKVPVENKITGHKTLMLKELFEQRKDEFKIISTKGMMPVIDKRTNEKLSVTVQDYETFDHFVSRKCKKMKIFNSDDIVVHDIWGDFEKICFEYKLPKKLFWESFKNNGLPICIPKSKHSKTRFINRGYEVFVGWYAKED